MNIFCLDDCGWKERMKKEGIGWRARIPNLMAVISIWAQCALVSVVNLCGSVFFEGDIRPEKENRFEIDCPIPQWI